MDPSYLPIFRLAERDLKPKPVGAGQFQLPSSMATGNGSGPDPAFARDMEIVGRGGHDGTHGGVGVYRHLSAPKSVQVIKQLQVRTVLHRRVVDRVPRCCSGWRRDGSDVRTGVLVEELKPNAPIGTVAQVMDQLKRTLARVCVVIADAETMEMREETLNHWLQELKGVAFDAENVLNYLLQGQSSWTHISTRGS